MNSTTPLTDQPIFAYGIALAIGLLIGAKGAKALVPLAQRWAFERSLRLLFWVL